MFSPAMDGLLFFLIGGVWLMFTWRDGLRFFRARGWTVAEARVKSSRAVVDPPKGMAQRLYTVEYRVKGEVFTQVCGSLTEAPRDLFTGSRLTIRFNPRHPEEMVTVHWRPMHFFVAVLILVVGIVDAVVR